MKVLRNIIVWNLVIKRGISVSASKNQFFGGALPFGYDIDENKKYVVNETETVFVREIYELYAGVNTEAGICRYMNEQQVKTKKGKAWNKSSLKRILCNRRYLGYYLYQDMETKSGIPQIIDEDLFEQVKQQLDRNKKARSSRKADEVYILTTKLFCGLCESSMFGICGTSHTGEKHYYYKCSGARKGCKKKSIQRDLLDDPIIEDILKFLDDDVIDGVAKALYEMLQEENESGNILRLEKLLEENKKAADNLLTAVMSGKGTDLLLEKLQQVQNEQKDIQEQILIEKSGLLDADLPEIRKYVKRFKHLDYTEEKNRQDLVETFVNKIWLYDDRKAKVRYNITDFRGHNVGSFYGRMVEVTGIEPVTLCL